MFASLREGGGPRSGGRSLLSLGSTPLPSAHDDMWRIPSPVGEGGPRERWMRRNRPPLRMTCGGGEHLIRQPAAATFSHRRRSV